jgi:hypothetical protein
VVALALSAVALRLILVSPDTPRVAREDRNVASPALPPTQVATTTSPAVVPSATSTPGASAVSPLRAFAPLQFEAEAKPPTVMRRGADVETLAGASGGKVVRLATDSSRIEIRGAAIPRAGRYRITIYYVSAGAGSVLVSVADAPGVSAGVTAATRCCLSSTVVVAMTAGRQSIILARTSGSPAIDRIVIAQASP